MMMPSQKDLPEAPENGVTFAVPTAGVGMDAHIPNDQGTEPQATEPPLYAVVIHEGREVFYKRIGA